MGTCHRYLGGALAVLGVLSGAAQAGMPRVFLTEIAQVRLQTISFFVLGLLVCAFLVKCLWNWLRRDFSALPRLSYPKAVGAVLLWGLLACVVLVMISGARELMTPGAWERDGALHKLTDREYGSQERARREKLVRLRDALWRYADAHEGRFPPNEFVAEVDDEYWRTPQVPEAWRERFPELRYIYVGGLNLDSGKTPVAYEPLTFGHGKRFALLGNGEVKLVGVEEIARRLRAKAGRAGGV